MARQRRFQIRRREAQFIIGLCAVGIVALLQLFAAEPSRAELTTQARSASEYFAIDGDTIERREGGEHIRIANIDTPETAERAHCRAERQRGEMAKQRVRQMLGGGAQVEIEPLGRTDTYGRTVAYVAIDGRDVGTTLIAEHLARPWRGRREPWCGANGQLLL